MGRYGLAGANIILGIFNVLAGLNVDQFLLFFLGVVGIYVGIKLTLKQLRIDNETN